MKDIDLIDKYLAGSLSVDEEKRLEELLANDVDFAGEFNFRKDVQSAIASKKREVLKEKLKVYESDSPFVEEKASSKMNWKILSIAASLVLLFGLGWVMGVFTSNDYQGLYESEFAPYPNTVFSITRSDSNDSLERKAFVAYESEDFGAAITLFKELMETKNDPYVKFYLSQSYLGADLSLDAISVLEDLISEDHKLKAESLWYLGLAHIKNGNQEKAVGYLQELSILGTYKKMEVDELLKALD